MTENTDTQNPPPTEPPKKRFRDRRVGVVTLAASTVGALLIGGTFGAVSGGVVGYGVGHHDRPDRPAFVQRQDQPQSGMPGGGMPEGPQQFQMPNGQLPPGTTQEQDESDSSNS